jgi:hypothetical protein
MYTALADEVIILQIRPNHSERKAFFLPMSKGQGFPEAEFDEEEVSDLSRAGTYLHPAYS